MALLGRIKNKVRGVLYRKFLYKFGFGNTITKSAWEKQFSTGVWDYLYQPEEVGHYEAIVALYQKHCSNGSVLDVGCGQGVLYDYFRRRLNRKLNYLGIDISKSAVDIAQNNFDEVNFIQLDFDSKQLDQKFDVIIFNETLYYFNRPLKKIESCISHNINAHAYFIISMCQYNTHDILWKKLSEKYDFLEFREITNEKNQQWKVGLFKVVSC